MLYFMCFMCGMLINSAVMTLFYLKAAIKYEQEVDKMYKEEYKKRLQELLNSLYNKEGFYEN